MVNGCHLKTWQSYKTSHFLKIEPDISHKNQATAATLGIVQDGEIDASVTN